jgi:hypothetical protein
MEILTCVPDFNPVKSSVTPDGTAIAERIIVEQEVFDLLAEEAPPEPENVQVVARLARSGAAVGTGAGAGAGTAKTLATAERPSRVREKATIVIMVKDNTRLV